MKKALFFIIIIILCFRAYSQTIRGTLIDSWDNRPVSGVSVFATGTTIGTTTKVNGKFKLELPGKQMLPIAMIYPEYETVHILNYPNRDIDLAIKLNRDVRISDNLSKSVLPKSDIMYHTYLEIFRKLFLGTSLNAQSCKILNERVIVLKFNKSSNLVTVLASEPLRIENKALGYNITCYLEQFEFSPENGNVYFAGNFRFRQADGLTGEKLLMVQKKRELAYIGSKMEFLRSLWSNTLDSTGYLIRDQNNKELIYDSLVAVNPRGTKYLKYKGMVNVYHYSRNMLFSMDILNNMVYIDRLGYADPQGFNWIPGQTAFQNVGDLLPFDY